MTRRGVLILLYLLAAFAAAASGPADWRRDAALRDSLSRVHPRHRAAWLRQRGCDDSYYATFQRPESTGLRCVGRWPWGPSWELCGRDTLLFLGSGSGVRILSIADSVQPRQLGQIAARGLVSQLVVRDSLLFVACGNRGAQVYSVSDPAGPRELGSMDAVISDVAVKDTFCYAVGGDSLRIYNVARPSQPVLTGAVRDSGDVLAVASGYAYVAGNVTGMNVYDVRDPTSPQWVNARGGLYATLFSRRSLLLCSGIQPDYFAILNVSNPQNIIEVSRINGYGGWAQYADDYFTYLSCTYTHVGLHVIDIADSARPQLRGSLNPEGDNEWDPYVPWASSYGYLAADYGGLVVVDLHNVNSPAEAWSGYKAHQARDVHVDNSRCYVAEQCAGLRILDVSDPARPQDLGEYDTVGVLDVRSATARDSFAFITYWGDRRRFLRVLDVADPSQPTFAAEESCFAPPEDMVLRDSFVYCAEASRFQIVNVARPREPRLVGSCNAGDLTRAGLVVQDTLAYFTGPFVGMQVFSVANPASPYLVNTVADIRAAGVDIVDTLLYVGDYDDSLHIWSFASPRAPVQLSSLHLTRCGYGTVVLGRYAYVASDARIRVVDVGDPLNPVQVDSGRTPYEISRVVAAGSKVYVCCWDAGVCIFDTTQVGIADDRQEGPRVAVAYEARPNPTRRYVCLGMDGCRPVRAAVFDASGRAVAGLTVRHNGKVVLDMAGLVPGLYFVELESSEQQRNVVKVLKQ